MKDFFKAKHKNHYTVVKKEMISLTLNNYYGTFLLITNKSWVKSISNVLHLCLIPATAKL